MYIIKTLTLGRPSLVSVQYLWNFTMFGWSSWIRLLNTCLIFSYKKSFYLLKSINKLKMRTNLFIIPNVYKPHIYSIFFSMDTLETSLSNITHLFCTCPNQSGFLKKKTACYKLHVTSYWMNLVPYMHVKILL